MAWYFSLIKEVGKPAAGLLIDKFGGADAPRLKEMLLGKDGEVKRHIQKLDDKIDELVALAKESKLETLFGNYNSAGRKLDRLYKDYEDHKDKEPDNVSRRNARNNVLGRKGAFYYAGEMIQSLCYEKFPQKKTFFQEYADVLMEKRLDVYGYREQMSAVMEHLKLNLIKAAALRRACLDESNKGGEEDVELSEERVKEIDKYYSDLIRPAQELIDLFERLSRGENYVHLRHPLSGNYLTAYEKGKPLSEDPPFGSYSWSLMEKLERHGMPQVFANRLGRGQAEGYEERVNVRGNSGVSRTEVKLDFQSQEWRVFKVVREGKPVRFMFVHRESGGALDGVPDGRVYVNRPPEDKGNEHMWWEPILTKNGAGEFEPGVCLLKHAVSGRPLDSDGRKVYAVNAGTAHDNNNTKWRLVQKAINVLEPDEYLAPGEELTSRLGRFGLVYKADGNLVLYAKHDDKILWQSGTAGKGAWRCVMQKKDGNFVVYAREGEPVWATNRFGDEYAGSRLVLSDDGLFEVTDKAGRPVWEKWRVTRKSKNTLAPDEFIPPGLELMSQNDAYALRYRTNGNLELFDTKSQKVLWDTGTGLRGAGRCVVQKQDGNFVVYDAAKKAAWATNVYGQQYADSRVLLSDEGALQVVDRRARVIWQKTRDGKETRIKGL